MRSHTITLLLLFCSWAGCDPALHLITSPALDASGGLDAADGFAVHDGGGDSGGAALLVHQWSKAFGSESGDRGHAVAVDEGGNVTLTGFFGQPVDFGGGLLPTTGSSTLFIASYDVNGSHRWSKATGGGLMNAGEGVAVDGTGNVFATGHFEDSADFGGHSLQGVGAADVFVARVGRDGTPGWAKGFGGQGLDDGAAVAVDASGNVVLAGVFSYTPDFGGGPLAGGSHQDAFVASFDHAGAHRWSAGFGSSSNDRFYGVAVDGDGNIVVVGGFEQSVAFGGDTLISAGETDIVVASYLPDGAHRWSKRFGGSGYDVALGVGFDSQGNVTLTGQFAGDVDFGGGPLSTTSISAAVVASYDTRGMHRWSKVVGSAGSSVGRGVAVSPEGDAIVVGEFAGSIEGEGGPLPSSGGLDIFLASFDASGARRGARAFGGSGHDRAFGVAMHAGGDVYLTGAFHETVDFGGGPLTSAGWEDLFVVKLGPPR